MSNRSRRRAIAHETLEILERGTYTCDGNTVDITDELSKSIEETRHYSPGDFAEVFAARDATLRDRVDASTRFEVANTTTLSAARSLLVEDPVRPVMCLNFASAKNPGGGFLGGSQAQEESLARASGLYASINSIQEYYETNRSCGTCLYTEHMIYSPDVPVFRDDRDGLLEQPYNISIITSPAVNAGALAANAPDQLTRIAATMRGRIERVLSVAVLHGHRALVLGAWGCGVFRNDPTNIAKWFHEALCDDRSFAGAFDVVVFAVLDHTPDLTTIGPFEAAFAKELTSHAAS